MSNRRYWVFMKSGRKFLVEEFGQPHIAWGNINPATKKLEAVTSKESEEINETNTQITPDRFKNIVMLNKGTSPIGYIEAIDKSGVEKFEDLDCGKYL